MTDADYDVRTDARWRATVHYRHDTGRVDVVHDLDELGDLHHLVERAPHWDTVERIEIVRVNHNTDPELTVEASREI